MLQLFLGEAMGLACVAAMCGTPAGWLLAQVAVQLTSTTVNTLYVTAAANVPGLGFWDFVLSAAVAIPLALIAAIWSLLVSTTVTSLPAVASNAA